MNTKHIKAIANAMETETLKNVDSIRLEDEINELAEKETVSTTENRDIKRKIVKQTDIDEKDQSNEPFDKMKLIKENLTLLSEIDKLKKSNHSMSQRIYYLETIVKVPLKKS